MIKIPHTYSEWAEILDLLKNKENDQEVLKTMKQGTLEWQSGVAERFVKQLTNTVNSRMNQATDQFQKRMMHTLGNENLIVQALIGVRKEMKFLSEVMNISALPESNRQQYIQLVRAHADAVQKSLEESAERIDRTGRLSYIIRNNKVNMF